MKKINVLIVDDDEIINEIVTVVLSKPFPPQELAWYNIKDEVTCQVYTASDAIEASLAISQHVPDVILLDVEMPYMDGFQFLKSLRDDDHTQSLPVIMLTASADRNTVYKAAKLGAVGYLKKPFLPEDLIKRILRTMAPALRKSPHKFEAAEQAGSAAVNLDAILEDLQQQNQPGSSTASTRTMPQTNNDELASLMQNELNDSSVDASIFDTLFQNAEQKK